MAHAWSPVFFLYKYFLMNIINVCTIVFPKNTQERIFPTSKLLYPNYTTTVSKNVQQVLGSLFTFVTFAVI